MPCPSEHKLDFGSVTVLSKRPVELPPFRWTVDRSELSSSPSVHPSLRAVAIARFLKFSSPPRRLSLTNLVKPAHSAPPLPHSAA